MIIDHWSYSSIDDYSIFTLVFVTFFIGIKKKMIFFLHSPILFDSHTLLILFFHCVCVFVLFCLLYFIIPIDRKKFLAYMYICVVQNHTKIEWSRKKVHIRIIDSRAMMKQKKIRKSDSSLLCGRWHYLECVYIIAIFKSICVVLIFVWFKNFTLFAVN